MSRRLPALALLGLLLCPAPAFPWGAPGHLTVARVAETLLTPPARAAVADLLGPGGDLAQVAMWADEIKPSHPETAPWHYVNLPRTAAGYDAARDCPHTCIVTALDWFLRVLGDPQADRAARQEALRWVVHFMGDIHQPLHAADDDDSGGADVAVRFFGKPSNLRGVWDGDIIERVYGNPEALTAWVLTLVTPEARKAWEAGTPAAWATESHGLAVRVAYAIPRSGELNEAYVAKALPVIHEQLAKAGVRLAWVLNRMLR